MTEHKIKDGAVVNIASTRALMSEPNTEAYSASKGGKNWWFIRIDLIWKKGLSVLLMLLPWHSLNTEVDQE